MQKFREYSLSSSLPSQCFSIKLEIKVSQSLGTEELAHFFLCCKQGLQKEWELGKVVLDEWECFI